VETSISFGGGGVLGFTGGLGFLGLPFVFLAQLLLLASARTLALTVICFSRKPSELDVPEIGLFLGVSDGLTPLLLDAQQPMPNLVSVYHQLFVVVVLVVVVVVVVVSLSFWAR